MEELQRINIKVFTEVSAGQKLEPFLDLFTAWKEQDQQWIDMADYLHMIQGPGVLLFGEKSFVSFDETDGDCGVLYSHRSALEGNLEQRFETTLGYALETASFVANHEKFPEGVSTTSNQLDITINDRNRTPETPEQEKTVESAISSALTAKFGSDSYELKKLDDSTRLFGYRVLLKAAYALK